MPEVIPKIIHYCWFGGRRLSRLAQRCVKSWYRYALDFELRLWNEKNTDLITIDYVKQAYESGKYAFVSDYVRLLSLYEHGGVYLDTDVELKKPLTRFLGASSFLGFESSGSIGSAIIGSVPGREWLKSCLKYYHNRDFILSKGRYETIPNVIMITRHLQSLGLIIEDRYQTLTQDIHIYPKSFFYPDRESIYPASSNPYANTPYAIHYCEGSWMTFDQRLRAFWFELQGRWSNK